MEPYCAGLIALGLWDINLDTGCTGLPLFYNLDFTVKVVKDNFNCYLQWYFIKRPVFAIGIDIGIEGCAKVEISIFFQLHKCHERIGNWYTQYLCIPITPPLLKFHYQSTPECSVRRLWPPLWVRPMKTWGPATNTCCQRCSMRFQRSNGLSRLWQNTSRGTETLCTSPAQRLAVSSLMLDLGLTRAGRDRGQKQEERFAGTGNLWNLCW